MTEEEKRTLQDLEEKYLAAEIAFEELDSEKETHKTMSLAYKRLRLLNMQLNNARKPAGLAPQAMPDFITAPTGASNTTIPPPSIPPPPITASTTSTSTTGAVPTSSAAPLSAPASSAPVERVLPFSTTPAILALPSDDGLRGRTNTGASAVRPGSPAEVERELEGIPPSHPAAPTSPARSPARNNAASPALNRPMSNITAPTPGAVEEPAPNDATPSPAAIENSGPTSPAPKSPAPKSPAPKSLILKVPAPKSSNAPAPEVTTPAVSASKAPASKVPASNAPASNAPASKALASNANALASNAPASNAPASNALASNANALASNAPASNAPGAPASKAPTSKVPAVPASKVPAATIPGDAAGTPRRAVSASVTLGAQTAVATSGDAPLEPVRAGSYPLAPTPPRANEVHDETRGVDDLMGEGQEDNERGSPEDSGEDEVVLVEAPSSKGKTPRARATRRNHAVNDEDDEVEIVDAPTTRTRARGRGQNLQPQVESIAANRTKRSGKAPAGADRVKVKVEDGEEEEEDDDGEDEAAGDKLKKSRKAHPRANHKECGAAGRFFSYAGFAVRQAGGWGDDGCCRVMDLSMAVIEWQSLNGWKDEGTVKVPKLTDAMENYGERVRFSKAPPKGKVDGRPSACDVTECFFALRKSTWEDAKGMYGKAGLMALARALLEAREHDDEDFHRVYARLVVELREVIEGLTGAVQDQEEEDGDDENDGDDEPGTVLDFLLMNCRKFAERTEDMMHYYLRMHNGRYDEVREREAGKAKSSAGKGKAAAGTSSGRSVGGGSKEAQVGGKKRKAAPEPEVQDKDQTLAKKKRR